MSDPRALESNIILPFESIGVVCPCIALFITYIIQIFYIPIDSWLFGLSVTDRSVLKLLIFEDLFLVDS